MATNHEQSDGDRVRIWDVPTRVFHWSFAGLILFAYISAEEDSPLNQWHMIAGNSVAVLLAFRIVWGFAGGEYARFASFLMTGHFFSHIGQMLRLRVEPTPGHNPLGGIAVLLMLLLAGAAVMTGLVLNGEGPHEAFGKAMIILAGIHVLAVFAMSLLVRENLARAMVTGTKPVTPDRSWKHAARSPVLAWILALASSVGTFAAIRANDPLAFSPRRTESLEENGNERGSHVGATELDDD